LTGWSRSATSNTASNSGGSRAADSGSHESNLPACAKKVFDFALT
jgi:hypothetical protein